MAIEDVGLRAVIQNMSAFSRDAVTANQWFAKIGQAAVTAAAQTQRGMTHTTSAVNNMTRASTAGFANTTKNMTQMAGAAVQSQGALFRLIQPLTQIGFAVFAVTALVAAFRQLGTAILGASTTWEQFQVTFNTLLKSASLGAAKLVELSDFARRTPFTLPQVVEASKQMLAYGFSAKELIPTLTNVGDAAAALGSGALERIIRALGQMRARTKVSAQEMLQLTETGIPAWQILSDVMGVSVAQVQKLSEKGLIPANQAVQVLLAGMQKRFGGLMEVQSKTFGGMLSNLQDWFFRAQVIFTKPLFEQLKKQLENLLKAIDTPAFTEALARWGEAAGRAVVILVRTVEAAARVIGPVLSAIGQGIRTTASILAGIGGTVRGFGGDLGTVLQASAIAVTAWALIVTVRAVSATIAWSAALTANLVAQARWGAFLVQFGVVTLADFILALARATASLVVYAVTGTIQALQATQRFMIVIATQAIPAMAAFTIATLRSIPGLVLFAVVGMGSVVRSVPALVVSLGALAISFSVTSVQAIRAALSIAAAWVATAAPAVLGAAGTIIAALGTVALPLLAIGAAAALIAVAWANNWGDIQGITGRVLNFVADQITNFIGWLETVPIIGGAVGQVKAWIGGTINAFRESAPRLVAVAVDAVGGIIDQFKNGFPIIQNALKDIFAPPQTGGELGPAQWEGFGSTAKAVEDAIAGLNAELGDTGDAAQSAGDKGQIAIHAMERQVDATKDAVQGLEDQVRGLESALRDAQDAMRGFSEPLLIGMGAADDAIFALEQALKQAQLEELQLGQAGKEAQKEVAASFNQLAAEQAEITQGIPVGIAKMQFAQEQARRAAEQSANKAAQAPKQAGETVVDQLQRSLRIAQLQKELNFDPQMRALKKHFNDLTGDSKEITFQDALAGMDAANATAQEITSQLGTAQGELEAQKAVLEAQQIILDALKNAYQDQADAARGVTASTTETLGLDNLRTAALALNTAELDKQLATMQTMVGLTMPAVGATQAAARPSQVTPEAWSGFASGGPTGSGGMARVGELGPENVLLPAGAFVVPSGPAPTSNISRSEANTWNISGMNQPMDVVDAIRRETAFRRLMRGRG